MRSIPEMLDELQQRAGKDKKLRQELLKTRQEANPLSAFCKKCRESGYEIYEMELINAEEKLFTQKWKRSTNGGGENSPVLEGEDDFYELFFAGLEQIKN